MRKILVAVPLIGLLCVGSQAQRRTVPRFEDYPAPVYAGKRAPVNLRSARGAGSYRTRLREGAKEGINFAGHYTLVQWGCGTGCLDAAIIDGKTGRVYFPDQLGGAGLWSWSDNFYDPLQFKPNSRLLVLTGFPASESNSEHPKSGLYYYEWTGTRLRLVRLIAKKMEEGH